VNLYYAAGPVVDDPCAALSGNCFASILFVHWNGSMFSESAPSVDLSNNAPSVDLSNNEALAVMKPIQQDTTQRAGFWFSESQWSLDWV
jgi:hypothetical protein